MLAHGCSARPARESQSAPAPACSSRYARSFKGQLDLERHGGHTPQGVTVRVLQRILALTAAIWHNDRAGQPVLRSLVAYDH